MIPPGPRPGNSGSRRLSCTALTSSQLSGEAAAGQIISRAARSAMAKHETPAAATPLIFFEQKNDEG